MRKVDSIAFEFVDVIPEKLKENTLFIAVNYATAVHSCCCGCGKEVVTPLSPTDWKLIYDGVSVSLSPSIGNWSFPCKSHYWIDKNNIVWASQWSHHQISAGRANDYYVKQKHYEKAGIPTGEKAEPAHPGLWTRLWKRIFG